MLKNLLVQRHTYVLLFYIRIPYSRMAYFITNPTSFSPLNDTYNIFVFFQLINFVIILKVVKQIIFPLLLRIYFHKMYHASKRALNFCFCFSVVSSCLLNFLFSLVLIPRHPPLIPSSCSATLNKMHFCESSNWKAET
jgi:hypothetical protein